ncbi:MAG: hypothetical protein GX464_00930, partial [Holophagae bacterium]|nr:hypothetical protein [Holophagae bacterium]
MPVSPPPPPPATLVTAVHAGRWAEVRAAIASWPQPMAPAVAVVAARAARLQGQPEEALRLVAANLPRAGELAAALRLE